MTAAAVAAEDDDEGAEDCVIVAVDDIVLVRCGTKATREYVHFGSDAPHGNHLILTWPCDHDAFHHHSQQTTLRNKSNSSKGRIKRPSGVHILRHFGVRTALALSLESESLLAGSFTDALVCAR